MSRLSILQVFGALSLLPTIFAHMQMSNPSPLRDPHANRPNEPKDYNILNPLNADGSNFACKGYQWNTPWTPVATYEAGGTYNMSVIGGATHGGGSCQLSFSCDGGVNFKVVKSIIGGCPLQSQYAFTVPTELGKLGRTTCLFAWTWYVEQFGVKWSDMVLIMSRFNKVGNREMYMNCAGKQHVLPRQHKVKFLINTVVNIVPRSTRTTSSKSSHSQHLAVRDTAKVNAVAQAALASYPDLFVANLASINTCVAPETHDVVFGDPGRAVQFGDDIGSTSKPTFQRNACIGKGHMSASISSGSASPPSSPSNSGSSTGGDDGQWHGGDSMQQQPPASLSRTVIANDGKYNPGIHKSTASQKTPSASQTPLQNSLGPVDVQQGNKQPNGQVQQELDAYLAALYGNKTPNKHRAAATPRANNEQGAAILADTLIYTRRQKRWSSYQALSPDENNVQDTSSNTQATVESELGVTASENSSEAPPPQVIDTSFAAFLQRLNSLSNSLFTLVKFASIFLDRAPPDVYFESSSTTTAAGNNGDGDVRDNAAENTRESQYQKRDNFALANGEMDSLPRHPSTAQEISTFPNKAQALRHWLQELKTHIAALMTSTQTTASRFGSTNDTVRLRRQTRTPGGTSLSTLNTETPFDWSTFYPSIRTSTSDNTQRGPGVVPQPRPAIVYGLHNAPSSHSKGTGNGTLSQNNNNNNDDTPTTNQTTDTNPLPTTEAKDTWIDGVFPFLLPFRTSPSSSGEDSDAVALLPLIMAPGPVLPSGVNVNDGSNLEHMPTVVNDLDGGNDA